MPGTAAAVEKATDDFTSGPGTAEATTLALTAPELAENGNSVRIDISVPGATDVMVLATDKPVPTVAAFRFGRLAATPSISLRIRLARTQEVIAIARMPDGTFRRAARPVEVVVGGCGA
jgi:sulfur-oxidizing protein SoxY